MFSSPVLKSMLSVVDDMSELKRKAPYQKLYEIAFALYKLRNSLPEAIEEDIPLDIGLTDVL